MLTAEQEEIVGAVLSPLMQYLEHEVIVDVANRIKESLSYTRTAELQAIAMRDLGYSPSKIRSEAMKLIKADEEFRKTVALNTLQHKKMVKRMLEKIQKEAYKANSEIMASAGNMSYANDLSIWKDAGKTLTDDSYLSQLVKAFAEQTKGELKNLTQTTGFKTMSGFESMENLYRRELDKALIKVCSGTFSKEKVIKDTVHELAQSGLRSIDFESGYSMQLDTAVRLAVRTGAHQLAGKIMDENMERTGENLVYVSKHWGARNTGDGVANHENWQGKVYYIKDGTDYSEEAKRIGQDRIVNLWYATGYSPDGTHENNPLGMYGYNCRHRHYVWFLGTSSLPDEQEEPKPVTIDGKAYDYYAITQKMRSMERTVRALKREKEALGKLGMDTKEIDVKIKRKVEEYQNFCEKCNVKEKTERMRYECGTSDLKKTKAYYEYTKASNDVKEIAQAKTHKRKVNITDIAISKVKRIELSGYSDEESDKLQAKHMELLTLAKNNNNSNEVVNMFSTEFDETITTYGNEKSVAVSKNPDARAFMMKAKENSVIWTHNHPKGSTFSYDDIGSFMQPQIRTFSVVTNQGKIYCLNKTKDFAGKELYAKMKTIRETYKDDPDYQINVAKEILKVIEQYGVEYIR